MGLEDPKEREKIGLIGAIVKKKYGDGLDLKAFGLGVILETRSYYGEIQVKVGWFKSPYILFQAERKVGWQIYDALVIVSKPCGDKRYVN